MSAEDLRPEDSEILRRGAAHVLQMGCLGCVVLAIGNLIFLLELDWRISNCFYAAVYSVHNSELRTAALGAATVGLAILAISAFRIQRRLLLSANGTEEATRAMLLARITCAVFLVMLVAGAVLKVRTDC